MAGGIAVAVSSAPASPLALVGTRADWALPPADAKAWLETAHPGSRLLYAQGERLVRGKTSTMMLAAQRAGDVFLFQPRGQDHGGFDYIAVKRVTEQSKRMEGRTADPAMRVIYRRLKRAAETGERCPSDAELGELVGLRVPQVKWRIRKLVADGRIATRAEATPFDPRFRVVSILDKDGKVVAETATPYGAAR